MFPTTLYISEEQIRTEKATRGDIPLGTRGVTPDGRVFRWAQAGGTALKAHRLMIPVAQGPWSTATDIALATGVTAGATGVKIYLGATDTEATRLVADFYKDGYMIVPSTDEDYNQMAPIHSNPALASNTALNSANWFYFKNPLAKAVATSTSLPKFVPNPYKFVQVLTDNRGMPLGVTPIAVTANYFFWLQTWGPALVKADTGAQSCADQQPGWFVVAATGGTGAICMPSTNVSMSYDTDSGGAMALGAIGNLITAPAADTFHALVELRLSP